MAAGRRPGLRTGQRPQWDADAAGYTDPTTGRLLPSWHDALDLVDDDPDAEPVHVVRFGLQVDAKGVLAGTKDADRCVGYITKYLTKQAAPPHRPHPTFSNTHSLGVLIIPAMYCCFRGPDRRGVSRIE
ncbi:replication initiator [Micromonospora sp. NPDC005806]|uniref:replication initiator n=1 Tax=Micromonospora sp. NPDC005806 TaxID=3364234 RepID=UPI0036A0525B